MIATEGVIRVHAVSTSGLQTLSIAVHWDLKLRIAGMQETEVEGGKMQDSASARTRSRHKEGAKHHSICSKALPIA